MPTYSPRSGAAWLLLVPALAVAAPRHHKPPPSPGTQKGSASGSAAGSDTTAADTGSATGSAAAADTGSAAEAPKDVAAPTPKESPKETKGNEPDVDSLRQEYLSLRDELFKSRARANAVASALYSTRVQIRLTWTSGRYYSVAKAQIRLDGATVYEDAGGAIASDDGIRFDGYVAPGRHLVTFHVEATGKDDDSFTSTTESQVVVKAVANKDLVVAAKAHDSGDIAYQWKREEHGTYGLGIDVGVKATAPPPVGGAKK